MSDHEDDFKKKNKSGSSSPAIVYYNLLLQHVDKPHLFSFIALIFVLTLFVILVPLTQPRVLKFSSSRHHHQSQIISTNVDKNVLIHHEKSQRLHMWLDSLDDLNFTLSYIFSDALPKMSQRLEIIHKSQIQELDSFSEKKNNNNINNNDDDKKKIITSVKDFQILLENEISQIQKEKEEVINEFAPHPPPQNNQNQQQQQLNYYQNQNNNRGNNNNGNVPDSVCEGIIKNGNRLVASSPRVAGGNNYNNNAFMTGQMIENEAPSEAVSERPGGPYVSPTDIETREMDEKEKAAFQRDFVKQAFVHSWRGYHDFAWGMDELQPRTCNGKNWGEENAYVSLSLSMLDGLTTMHVMGLDRELEEALAFLKQLSFNKQTTMSTFETTIRVVGSLLSIYELRGEREKWILDKARDVADRLMFAYNTTTGLPHNTVDLLTHRHFSPDWAAGASVLSEFGTVQLELRTLSFHTRDPSYDMRATHIMDIVEAKAPIDFLCPVYMSLTTANWITDHVSMGALGDSFYEYVIKQYLLTGRTEKRYRDMARAICDAVVDRLVFRSAVNGWAYMAEWRRNEFYHKQDHLACFFGGNLALAAQKVLDPEANPEDRATQDKWMKAAADLVTTCYEMYHQQKSGVSPEYVEFISAGADFVNGPGYYILRPETMEALFYLWRFTKEQKWRDYAWNIFRAIDRWCKVSTGGYAGLKEVNVRKPVRDNLQQSFWLAETLKYSYLIFADDSVVDLDEWVFNTEAHPLKIRKRDPLDVWREYENENDGRILWDPPVLAGVSEIKRTETESMKKRRIEGHLRHSAKDEHSEELDAGAGVADDEGLPFEGNRGMRGIPIVSRQNRGSWFGVQPANVLYSGPLPKNYKGMVNNNNNNNRFQYQSYNNYHPPAYSQKNPNPPPQNNNNNNGQQEDQQQQQRREEVPQQKKVAFGKRYKGAFQKGSS
jgi:mannosyl-oligosaccharide alpha-1,2-mannosidase